MSFRYTRRYTGPVEAVIFDWAGTVIDFGCMAPADAFIELFKRENVALTAAQAREPMGTEKREHIRRLLLIPAVAAGWQSAKGSVATTRISTACIATSCRSSWKPSRSARR